MASLQFSVRIPSELDQKVKEYAIKNNTTKSDVMIAALARYLDCESKIPLTQRVVELEKQLTIVQEQIKIKNLGSSVHSML